MMKVNVVPGRYILGVSGGVDSMVLLDLVHDLPGVEVVVAHFDHGIRGDSHLDERLVSKTAKNYNLTVEVGRGKLGKDASEDTARTHRYRFLSGVKQKYAADALMTAHHQDDLIETVLINLLRGTGRIGISSMIDSKVVRPLLDTPKEPILRYAKLHGVKWRQDSTNDNTDYLRNYLRLRVLPRLSREDRDNLVSNIDKVANINTKLKNEIATLSHLILVNGVIDRRHYTKLPPEVSNELVIAWLRDSGVQGYDRKTIERLALVLKTGLPGTRHTIKERLGVDLARDKAWFVTTGQTA